MTLQLPRRKRFLSGVFFMLAALLPAAAAAQCPAVVWADEFDGTQVDEARWSYQIGDGCDIGLCGWGNNELQYYKAENATVGNGTLKITAKRERVKNKEYTSARIRTINKGEWYFGRFEARIKLTQGKGIWPAFWMLPTDEVYGGWPQSGEIDIMENVGHEKETVHGTIHYGDPYPDNRSQGTSYRLHEGIFADAYHTFAMEKEAGVIRWFVDDQLFFTRTAADIAPYNWPFDERFHFILNVAVGGNWPGSPDETTVFPQVLEVDYVRVYDAARPHLAGDRTVPNRSSGEVYSVGNAPAGSTFSWSIPAGATLVTGQGTASITVDWGDTGGDVVAQLSSDCGTQQLVMNVLVEPPYARDFSFENFDEPANVTLDSRTTGSLVEVDNPDPSGVNTSARSGAYTRDAAEQYDVLFYATAAVPDAGAYKRKEKKFFIDLYTAAAVGTQVLLQLESTSLATSSNYPTGRHSRYQAFTSAQNAWQRLELAYLDAPDPSTPDDAVDNIVLLFAPNTTTGDVYYFDNLDSYAVVTSGTAPAAPSDLTATTASASQIDLAWTDHASDEESFRIERAVDGVTFAEIGTVAANTTQYADAGLSAATTYTYRVRAVNAYGSSPYSNTASATTASGGSATTLHVAAITTGTQNAGQGRKHGTATVTIHDDTGAAVAGATVTGTFSGTYNETATGTTDAGGAVTLVTTGTAKGSVSFTFCVDDVSHASLTYDAASNVVTCSQGSGKRDDAGGVIPDAFALEQNYPNPFNPSTHIRYALPERAPVRVVVTDALGKVVRVLVDEVQEAGHYAVAFDARELASGVYFYQITAAGFQSTRAMALLR